MFRMTPHGHRFSNGGLTDSQLPLDVPGGSSHLGYLPRAPVGRYPTTRVKTINVYRLPTDQMRAEHNPSVRNCTN